MRGPPIRGFLLPRHCAFPRVVDGGILNKQTRSGPPAWWFGVMLTTSHYENIFDQKHRTGPRNSTDDLERPWQRKIDMRFDT